MTKDELKLLAKDMYDKLLDSLNEEDEPTMLHMISHLRETIDIINSIKDDNTYTPEHSKAIFNNAFKDVAKNSLKFYENTNTNFKELSDLQSSAIEDCNKNDINLSTVLETFTDIQLNMTKEINKANTLISELVSQVKILEKKSNIDPLTKVFNRRTLDTYLTSICSKEELRSELHILMLDLDNFKNLNDTHGHLAGDKTLVFVSNILKKTLRDGDRIFRYGGEEFLIVLNRINDELCLKISNRSLSLIRDSKLIYKGKPLNVTASIGATKYKKGDTISTLIDRADKALYEAKMAGKDQIITKKD
jgi:diguanylate cyclase (GGDEF)-like protein